MVYFLIFFLGITVGSFLNVCIYRIPKEESIVFPPSHCPNCNNHIKVYDLIPVISYIILKGECRHCGEKISIKYPIMEILTGVLFLLVFYIYGYSIESIKFMLFQCYIIVVAAIDIETTDVYLSTSITGATIGIAFLIHNYFLGISSIDYIYGALVSGGFITLIIITTKGMGWGDAEICIVCGLFLGFRLVIIALFSAFLIGALVSIVLIILNIKSRKNYIPFGPFLALGAALSTIWGNEIIIQYISLFNM